MTGNESDDPVTYRWQIHRPDFVYTTLNEPSATGGSTDAEGLNDAGQIVGNYSDGSGYHGFVYSGGTYTTLDDPLATVGTNAFSINDAGQIVGLYTVGSVQHGYLYSGGTYTTLDVPSADFTEALGINDAGQIVGIFHDGGGYHGFLYSGGTYTTLDDPLRQMATSRNRHGGLRHKQCGSDRRHLLRCQQPPARLCLQWRRLVYARRSGVKGCKRFFPQASTMPGRSSGKPYGCSFYSAGTYRWTVNGAEARGINDSEEIVGQGFLATPTWTDISGETGPNYIVTEGDDGQQLQRGCDLDQRGRRDRQRDQRGDWSGDRRHADH